MEKLERLLELGGIKKDIAFLVISAMALVISIFELSPLPFDPAWVAIILCGLPIVAEAVIGLVTKFDIKADVLVSIALIASIIIHEDFAAGEIAFIMQLGALLEDLTVAKARAGIENLVRLTPRTARVISGNTERIIPAEDVKAGDIIRVLPGETIPVDGDIISGETSVNQAVMTGESLPVDKTVRDSVSSGTVNQFGSFDMVAVKVGEDSSIQRMIRLVQSADADKAKIVGLADRWATWIVVTALSAALVTWFATGEIIRSVTILVVFCPCALVLATPTAIMAAIGNATKHGFLVKEGDALERLSTVKKITFDKTGTLTKGTPEVQSVCSIMPGLSQKELFALTAAVEKHSEHPLGKAIVRGFEESLKKAETKSETEIKTENTAETKTEVKAEIKTEIKTENFKMLPGKGVSASADGRHILAGNADMLFEAGIPTEALTSAAADCLSRGCTVIYVSVDSSPAGFIALSDTIRPEAAPTIAEIISAGAEPVLLTGDHKSAASETARLTGIKEMYCKCLPEDKLGIIDDFQKNGYPVCMVGDGVNDAPSLKKAMVGIAMGGVGSDIAVDAADIALVNDDIKELPHLFRLSKRMMTTIKFNLSFSMLLNIAAVMLAMAGILNPVVGALVHNGGSVFVIINSSLLLKWKYK